MTKLKHYDNLGIAHFITFSCYHRFQLLVNVGFYLKIQLGNYYNV